MKKLLISTFLILFTSCTTEIYVDDLKGNNLDYYKKINQAQLNFESDKINSEQIWSRGNSFINHHSKMQIQSANEYHVATFDPAISGDKIKFTVKCYAKKNTPQKFVEITKKFSLTIC